MDEAEHRGSPRVTRAFMVRHKAAEGGPSWFMSPLRDLSRSGARFMSEGGFDVGAKLTLELVLPAATQPVVVKALVAWKKPAPFGIAELGVTFEVDPQSATQQAIDTAVARFVGRQPPG